MLLAKVLSNWRSAT